MYSTTVSQWDDSVALWVAEAHSLLIVFGKTMWADKLLSAGLAMWKADEGENGDNDDITSHANGQQSNDGTQSIEVDDKQVDKSDVEIDELDTENDDDEGAPKSRGSRRMQVITPDKSDANDNSDHAGSSGVTESDQKQKGKGRAMTLDDSEDNNNSLTTIADPKVSPHIYI